MAATVERRSMILMNLTKLILRNSAWIACLVPSFALATQPRGMVGAPVYSSQYSQPAFASPYNQQALAGGYAPASQYASQYRPAAYPSVAPGAYPGAQVGYNQPAAPVQQAYYPPAAGYQPVAGYPPAAAGYAPQAGYAPAAPQQGFAISVPAPRPTAAYRVTYPAGDGYAAYAPMPQVAYRPVQQVTYMRPVVVYDPITARQVVYYAPCTGNTCYQGPAVAAVPAPTRCGTPAYAAPAYTAPACGVAPSSCGAPSGCGSQSKGWFGNCKLFNCKLFNRSSSNTCYSGTCAPQGCGQMACGPTGCGVPYTGIPAGCGGAVAQPYYNTVPAVTAPGAPIVTAPAAPVTVAPALPRTTVAPFNSAPGARFPAPATRPFGSLGPAPVGGAVAQPPSGFVPSGGNPADAAPSLNTPANPGLVPGAGTGVPPIGGAPTTSNYPPAYGAPATGFGSPYDGGSVPSRTLQGQGTYTAPVVPPAVNADGTPATSSSVKPFSDPDRSPEAKPSTNQAPQLLDPRDRTARAQGASWPVVPAKWPARVTETAYSNSTIVQPRSNTYREMSHRPETGRATPAADLVPVATPITVVDESGWESSL